MYSSRLYNNKEEYKTIRSKNIVSRATETEGRLPAVQ